MSYVIQFTNNRTARQAFSLLGSGYLAGTVDGTRLLFETFEHAQWAKRELEDEGLVDLTITEE